MTASILLAGVGGQGTILAAKILSRGLLRAGYDVKMSEIHGMSQRGGSVSSQVRYGERVLSPVIELGGADMIISFEKLEAARWLPYLRPGRLMVVNDHERKPMGVLIDRETYPATLTDELRRAAEVRLVAATAAAEALGNAKAANLVLLGCAVEGMELGEIDWEAVVTELVKPAYVSLNVAAMRAGRDLLAAGVG